jgi:hypothetical protein
MAAFFPARSRPGNVAQQKGRRYRRPFFIAAILQNYFA